MKHYDTILFVEPQINEADERIWARTGPDATIKSFTGSYLYDDPSIHQAFGFGKMLQSRLESMGRGWGVEVTDFNKWVTCRVTHSDTVTGRSSSKTYLIVFQPDKSGMVLSTANKYRTISGVDQAASYIQASCRALADSNQRKL